jgi:hypothetical protein
MKKVLVPVALAILLLSCALPSIHRQPGIYDIGRIFYSVTFANATISLSIDQLEILDDYSYRISVTWSTTIQPGGPWDYIHKGDDSYNPDMYCTDDLGFTYPIVDSAGVGSCYLYNGDSQSGWFAFSALSPGAGVLYFHDDDQGRTFEIAIE